MTKGFLQIKKRPFYTWKCIHIYPTTNALSMKYSRGLSFYLTFHCNIVTTCLATILTSFSIIKDSGPSLKRHIKQKAYIQRGFFHQCTVILFIRFDIYAHVIIKSIKAFYWHIFMRKRTWEDHKKLSNSKCHKYVHCSISAPCIHLRKQKRMSSFRPKFHWV